MSSLEINLSLMCRNYGNRVDDSCVLLDHVNYLFKLRLQRYEFFNYFPRLIWNCQNFFVGLNKLKTMEEKEDLLMTFDPSRDEVLGVFDGLVHVKTIDAIFIIPIDVYQDVWYNYLLGKQRMCSHYSEYCGVMGYTQAMDFYSVEDIELNEYVSDDDEGHYVKTSYPAFIVTKFDEYHDFEHG